MATNQKLMPQKEPGEILDYLFEMAALLEVGESATAIDVTVSGPDEMLTIVDTDEDLDAATCVAWVTGGTQGKRYRLTCLVTTDTPAGDDDFKTVGAEMLIPVSL